MVMDATQSQPPSPQSVGREFVRQYYTLLNKAPNHLHRFYNHNSSFIHDDSALVVGQKNIHNRIQQLNFHDCHAKISQVDSQATLGNGVVVQVTGELSNDGQPMRRFTQTFVLAAQSPKKYYVHNDIFRYQDIYSDDDNDGESRSEHEDEHEPRSTPVSANNEVQAQVPLAEIPQQPAQLPAQVVAASNSGVLPQQQQQPQSGAPQQIYFSLPPTGGRPVPVIAAAAPQGAVPLGAQFTTAGAPTVQAQAVQTAPTVGQLNGVLSHDELTTGILHPATQTNAGSGQAALVPQTGSPVVQAASAVTVQGAPVIATPHALATVAVPVAAAAGLAQTAPVAAGIPGFQQSPLMQQQLLQQQPQPTQQQVQPQQQQIMTANSQPQQQQTYAAHAQGGTQSQLQQNVDVDDKMNAMNIAANDVAANTVSHMEPPVSKSPVVEDFKTINEQQQQEKFEQAKQQQQQQNEPKTYANLFKSTTSSPSGFVNAVQQQQQLQQQQQQQQQQSSLYNAAIPSSTYTASNNPPSSAYNRNSNNNGNEATSSMATPGQNPLQQRTNQPRLNKDFEQRRSSNAQQFGDNQQLFLGNIPHHASEEELKTLFSRFGNVLELRILSKVSGKLPPGVRNPLNYGFITYEDPESVQNCLANCPLYFPENSPDRQKLNVEEKKPRIRNDLPPRQGGNNMNNNMNTQRNNMGGNNGGGHPARSISNSSGGVGGMMRVNNNPNGNSMSRGNSGGPRMGGAFNRNENRNGSQMRGGGGGAGNAGSNNNAQSASGGNYGGRR